MNGTFFNKNISFNAALFTLWAVFLLVKYNGHRFEENPVPSAGLEQSMGPETNAAASLQAKVLELRHRLARTTTNTQKSMVLQDIGYAYANLFNTTGNVSFRDSAVENMRHASTEEPGNGRLHYRLGKFYGAIGYQQQALEQYTLALQCDSTYMPAFTDAAACSYFGFNRSEDAKRYSSRALKLDSQAPLCHLILGLIDLDAKKIESGSENLKQEIVADESAMARGNTSLDVESIRFAAATAHYRLMRLYCSQVPDMARAREHLDGYLRFETDPTRKSAAIDAMKKRWGS
jgi:tetratricopeptide (TPR) repeat protein